MKNRCTLLFVAMLFFCGIQASQASSRPSALSIEYIRDTQNVNIADPLPEYSWQVPQQAVSQSAYQLLVATSEQNLVNNFGDVWDSQKVTSSASIIPITLKV